MPQIDIENLTVEYANGKDKVVALDDLSVTLLSNAFNVIVGYSGSGKTTLLRTIAGQLSYNGTICFDGVNVTSLSVQKRNLAFVSQQFLLYANKTIFDNIAFPLKVQNLPKTQIIDTVRNVANQLDLVACLTRKPKHLSGGQQQRVALAKALVKQPSICLLDEPFSNVDPTQRFRSRVLVKQTLLACNCTTVYVTHDLTEAMAMADRLIVMNNGKVVACGAPLDVYNSGNPIVESLKQGSMVTKND